MNTHAVHMQHGSEHQQLAKAVRETVGSFLGTRLRLSASPPKTELSPIANGVFAAGLYALIPVVQMLSMRSSPELILLSWWGVIYFGLVVTLTQSTSRAVIEVVEVLLLPNISEECAHSVRENIEKNFARPTILVRILVTASVATLVSCAILGHFYWVHLCVWGLGFFMLYFTASQTTLTAPFYTCFSDSLKKHSDVLFPIDPAASPAVSACTVLAKRILSYWFLVSLLVVSLMALLYVASPRTSSTHLYALLPYLRVPVEGAGFARFIFAVVLVAGFFSFGFGSLVYLRFESDLRIAVDRVRLTTLSTVQARYRELSSSQGPLSPEEWVQLGRLKRTSDYLSRSGYLRGTLQTLATVLAAILPPVVSIVGAVLAYNRGH